MGMVGSSHSLSSTFHLSTKGLTERSNAIEEQYLCCYVNYQQMNWAELLPFAEVAYNNGVHSSTGFTPFKLATGVEFMPMPGAPIFNHPKQLGELFPTNME